MKPTRPLASALYYTYTLSNNKCLYVPLTSQCNSCSLPETRGPEFLLPPHVVASLLRVRDYEHQSQQWSHWCMWLDTQDHPQKLPPLERNVESKSNVGVSLLESFKQEIDGWIDKHAGSSQSTLVIAGEGEPTLRWDDLLDLSATYSPRLSIRINTNGLLNDSCRKVAQLKQHGVDQVSVALQTANPSLYNTLMEPMIEGDDAHALVCDFIQQAVACELNVEVTGVDRPDVDKEATEQLARDLGVSSKVRWRPYFS